jgi:hypothetical protein
MRKLLGLIVAGMACGMTLFDPSDTSTSKNYRVTPGSP